MKFVKKKTMLMKIRYPTLSYLISTLGEGLLYSGGYYDNCPTSWAVSV